jgi:hypothetical protein
MEQERSAGRSIRDAEKTVLQELVPTWRARIQAALVCVLVIGCEVQAKYVPRSVRDTGIMGGNRGFKARHSFSRQRTSSDSRSDSHRDKRVAGEAIGE